MKILKYNLSVVILLVLFLSIFSCAENNDYLKFTDGKEISYTGKMDSLKIYSGHNRVKLEGLIISDPKVSEFRVYWTNGQQKDSAIFPVTRSAGVDEISQIITDLPENVYNFEVKTFDADGNSSVSQFVTTEVFGDRYVSALSDRAIASSVLDAAGTLTINFASMDLTTGAFATEVIYLDNANVEHTITVPVTQSQLVIPNFKQGGFFQQRSLFLPVATSIDTFYTALVAKEPSVADISYMIKNNTKPFATSSYDGGRWGVLADWTTNAAAKNHGGYGGYDGGCCGNIPSTFNIETGWGSANVVNGKIFQTIILEAGTYIFKTNPYPSKGGGAGQEGNFNASTDYVYLTAAAGTDLADSDNGVLQSDPVTLGYKRLSSAMDITTWEFEFTVPSTQEVSIGLSASIRGDKFGHLFNFKLFKVNK